jgi:hypothetical protein
MNQTTVHPHDPGYALLLAAGGLANLPDGLHAQLTAALLPGATMTDVQRTAHALAEECPVLALQGLLASLIFLANPDVTFDGQALNLSQQHTQKGVVTHG